MRQVVGKPKFDLEADGGGGAAGVGEIGAVTQTQAFRQVQVRSQTAEDCRCYNAPLCVPVPP